jgi:hypothetical protein
MTVKQITIKVSRTVQISAFNPVQVEVTETHDVPDTLSTEELTLRRKKIYSGITKAVFDYINNEQRKYKAVQDE